MTQKNPPVRDRKYLDWLRTQPCIITGCCEDAIDPMHIGTYGKGLKSSDDQVLPVGHRYHRLAHQNGEITMFRKHAPNWLLRAALRAYAREMYREWKNHEQKR